MTYRTIGMARLKAGLDPEGQPIALEVRTCMQRAEDPPEIDIRFFPTGHWLIGMGHDRATSIQSAIGDAIFQITGKRFRDLPYNKHDLTWS